MGPDSGLAVEVALAREGELSSLHTESRVVANEVWNLLCRKGQLEGLWGVTCSLEWWFRKGTILPAGGGMAGHQARCSGIAHGCG